MINILASSNNQRGDIFTRLVSDFFHTIGYDRFRFNIAQAGREIDIIGTHCTEKRMVVAECKSESKPIGGSELNKFAGALGIEQSKAKMPVEGYYISLSGFTETGIQQEHDNDDRRFTLITSDDVTARLISGRIIADQAKAVGVASAWLDPKSELESSGIELLADESGWYWLVTFTRPGALLSHFSIVHADGHALDHAVALPIAKRLAILDGLDYVGPAVAAADKEVNLARGLYLDHLVKEHGFITLEGLPADQEVGSRSLRLENIFVPLEIEALDMRDEEDSDNDTIEAQEALEIEVKEPPPAPPRAPSRQPREPVGRVLAHNNRLALLGSPGSGKTTLLKRLAVAYAVPARRSESRDMLPKRDWFPIVIRCRLLGTEVSQPILRVIESLAERAEMPELGIAFRECVMAELRAGRVLLLVDGLDEIASPGNRANFVGQLRTFLGTYPSASLVLTSREYGFRNVAGAIGSLCSTYKVSELSARDVRTITQAWHKEVVGDSDNVRRSAAALANSILRTDRVRRLAVNPLLLTTLLLVRRWLGELPRKRSVLYAKAIEVLLMTWNVEGHLPLDPDEALPQLAFVAFRMMQDEVQVVSIRQLTDYFNEARSAIPEVLAYSRTTVSEFVTRVEERSSLLSLSGYVLEDGQLRATYEFKHLTFQEYLAAYAAAHGFYPGRETVEGLVGVLAPYLDKPAWQEVIPLAGVLGGRHSSALVERLIAEAGPIISIEESFGRRLEEKSERHHARLLGLLANCLTDDVPMVPDTLERAIFHTVRQMTDISARRILTGKYADQIYSFARQHYSEFADGFVYPYGSTIGAASAHLGFQFPEDLGQFEREAVKRLRSDDPMDRAEACLWAMNIAFDYRKGPAGTVVRDRPENLAPLGRVRTQICRHLEDESDPRVLFAGFWAMAWLADLKRPTKIQTRKLIPLLWDTLQNTGNTYLCRQAAWTIWALPVISREEIGLVPTTQSDAFLETQMEISDWCVEDRRRATLIMAYYFGSPFDDAQLLTLAVDHYAKAFEAQDPDHMWWLKRFTSQFGAEGRIALREGVTRARRSRTPGRRQGVKRGHLSK